MGGLTLPTRWNKKKAANGEPGWRLRALSRAMGTCAIIVREWRSSRSAFDYASPLRVLEIGAGDGSLMLRVARALGPQQRPVALTLLDRLNLVERQTVDDYAALGWTVASRVADIHDWAGQGIDGAAIEAQDARWHLIIANLFLHHFDEEFLRVLLRALAARASGFLAVEPRRSALALAGSRLVGALGANAVTRNDAVLSVRAGFRDSELTRLWPMPQADWTLREYPAGLFSHCFGALRGKRDAADRL